MIELVSSFYVRRMMLLKTLFAVTFMSFVFFLASYPDFRAGAHRNGGNLGKLENISSVYLFGLFVLFLLWLTSAHAILRFDQMEKKAQAYEIDEFSRQFAQTVPLLMFIGSSCATVALMAYIHVNA